MNTLTEGSNAPDFSLHDQNGKIHKLSDYKGKKVILYFYPKDDTPGCTREACNFRDDFAKYKKKNAIILGISIDPVKLHKKFEEKYSLPFTILSDDKREIVNAYKVWKKKKFMGKEYMGTMRETFLIDEKGIIIKHFTDVKTKEHSKEILELV